eukprot:TRINITY_DN2678_c0_g1_i2.p1 TRINITY_DN2678_c0_g1~~TRINITY_DN2678_c0_g1_i2.p1  ORF type:complete len:109 (+),score=26.31 TRINITY_DN2678_c0_g1_i2:57-383(+)
MLSVFLFVLRSERFSKGPQFVFFFFKQKTAYEMQRGLVGSEMCIRDRQQRQPQQYRLISVSNGPCTPVSYTHLTLPTILLVQISVVAVSLKKKNTQTVRRHQWRHINY